jgi:hypothetical protein
MKVHSTEDKISITMFQHSDASHSLFNRRNTFWTLVECATRPRKV